MKVLRFLAATLCAAVVVDAAGQGHTRGPIVDLSSVVITGGTINATSIGGTSASSGIFTTLRSTGLSTGLVLGASASNLSTYAGTSCTNQFPRSLDASGAATCASVANGDLAGSIAASKLVGSDIATVGTVTAGTWSATAIGAAKGGTGQDFSGSTGLVKFTAGTAATFGGTSCTNQFPRSLDASGAATCASVANADLAGSIAAAKLVGSDIATVGTVTAGTWSATAIATTSGGTGQSTTATTGRYLKGNGSVWGTSTGSASGTGACGASNWASTLNSDAAPTCTQPAASDLSNGTTGSGSVVLATSPTFTTSAISPLWRSTAAKVLVQGTGTGATQLSATQTTAPTCTTSCGTSPSVTGTDTAMIVTMGSSGTPASGWVVTFNGTWGAAPACIAQSALATMVVGKMPIAVVTTTTTITVTTNGTAPAVSDKYFIHCIGVS